MDRRAVWRGKPVFAEGRGIQVVHEAQGVLRLRAVLRVISRCVLQPHFPVLLVERT